MSELRVVALAIEVAAQQQEMAAKNLSQARHAHADACRQREQLSGYAAETQARWSTGARATAAPELLLHHSQFMERLAQAMVLQDRVIEDKLRRVDDLQQQFVRAQSRLSGLEKILAKKQSEIAVRAARREQKETDELAARRSRRDHLEQEQAHGH